MPLIPFGNATGDVSMLELRNFYGKLNQYTNDSIAISNLYKGGLLVPNISQNSSIPTSGAISLSNFRNSYNNFYWEDAPNTQGGFGFNLNGGTVYVQWQDSNEASSNLSGNGASEVGYGGIKNSAYIQFRWVFRNNGSFTPTIIRFGNSSRSYPPNYYDSGWHSNNYFSVELDYPGGVTWNNRCYGTIEFHVRYVYNGSTYTISTQTVNWALDVESGLE